MGLDATILRRDGLPLGQVGFVERQLAAAFPGARFVTSPTGKERLRQAAERGYEFPDAIRRHFESLKESREGDFEGDRFSVEFHLGSDQLVKQVDLVLRGETTLAGPLLDRLEQMNGWVIEYFCTEPGDEAPPPSPEEIAAGDRAFFDLLGPERPGTACQSKGCTRGQVKLSLLCRRHHFEMIIGRPCVFEN